jgi:16S rRNA (cytosine967-C5)-methyltransferase
VSVAPARSAAFAVLRRVFEQGAYADRALRSEAAGLDPRDRALASALAFGAVQRRATLDHFIAKLADRQPDKLDPPVCAALRLGLLQLLFLDRVPAHAAINESVELAKRGNPGAAAFVNAVLRRASREGKAILDELDDTTPDGAAIAHSVPAWLAELWFEELGSDEARALLRRINEPAESALRVNTLTATREDVLERLPVAARPAPALPEGLILDGPFDVHGSELFAEGAVMPQSRGSMQVGRELGPVRGERVLDLCAAPGAKTTHLAALVHDDGSIVAVERHPGRARALGATCRRMRARSVTVTVADAAAFHPDRPFDRVLVDPPCSGLGTLQSRPDLRWRASPDAISELGVLQRAILDAAAAATAPGGTIVYSVCTISKAESEQLIARFLEDHAEFTIEAQRQLLPHRDGTDGFYIAKLHRE